ncbi:hypothetical protein [Pseudooceanicola algae]|uniref:Uncharacterized protein n=1 Tax=Pseudooceanicola algae TaxID=1537215 RepID=A0A418SBP1_9RHOB|nr:hypothetical protein [Pseudooceanicola algae]QPM92476.1 hypothetical protein PSAL_037400 [Pseudooceanicola algae]
MGSTLMLPGGGPSNLCLTLDGLVPEPTEAGLFQRDHAGDPLAGHLQKWPNPQGSGA